MVDNKVFGNMHVSRFHDGSIAEVDLYFKDNNELMFFSRLDTCQGVLEILKKDGGLASPDELN